jgi:hypothetical protein
LKPSSHTRASSLAVILAATVLLPPGSLARSGAAISATSSTGTLDGRLTDWHSIPLADAEVVVRNLATGAILRSMTARNGSYHFTGLGPGEYRLEAVVPQLGKGSVDGILISAGHATRVQAALVMVLPTPPELEENPLRQLDPVAAAVTTMIPSEEATAVPMITRNWQSVAALTPGATLATPAVGQGSGQIGALAGVDPGDAPTGQMLSISGANGFDSDNRVDGMPSTPGFRSESGRQSHATESVGTSAILSMQARTGDGAPADGGIGGAFEVQTSHGQNGLHGQAFFLSRESLWGAQNPFTQRIQETAAASGFSIAQFTPEAYSPSNSRQTFGLGIGRQIKRDRLFWFAALDGLANNDPAVATVRHPVSFFAQPTNSELTVLAARLGLPPIDPVDEAAATYSAGLQQLAGLLGTVPRGAFQLQAFGRVDWQLTERQHLSTEGEFAHENAPSGALSRSSETYGSHSFGNSQASSAWAQAQLESFFTPNLLNAFGFQFRTTVESQKAQPPSAFEAPLLANTWGQLPEIVADSKYGFILGKPARLSGAVRGSTSNPDERAMAAQETLSWVRGAHLIEIGGNFDHIADAVNTLTNQTGTYSYADVLNFLSDESAFIQYGLGDVGNPFVAQHNCDATGKVRELSDGTYSGLGILPCYAWYSQRIGPSHWHLSTNDIAAFATEQWQPGRKLTLSAGIRMEAEQLPSPIAGVANSDLPATEKLPGTTRSWGPRFGLAWAPFSSLQGRRAGTVVRIGAGLYFGRIDNSTVLAALSQTGSPNGDLNFFFKPTDVGAPPFPYVFPVDPQSVLVPGAVSFAPGFRTQEVDQAVISVEQEMPSHWLIAISGLASLGRRLPIAVDTNLERAADTSGNPQSLTYNVVDASGVGPIKKPTITVPFYTVRPNTNYQQLSSLESRANSTYDAAMVKIVRTGGHALTLRAHYIYAHATDWNPNESGNIAGNDLLDPQDFRLEYGTSNLDMRHSAGVTVLYTTPWKLRDWAGYFGNAWSVAAVGQFRSGLPFTMRTSGYIPGYYAPLLGGGHQLIDGVATGMNGSGGDNRVYGIGRNSYRYPATWTADMRLSKRFNLAPHRELELLGESFNLFNHQNVTRIETTGYTIDRGDTAGSHPTFNFMTGLTKAGLPSATTVEFGKPLDVNATNYYRPREFQFGLRARF